MHYYGPLLTAPTRAFPGLGFPQPGSVVPVPSTPTVVTTLPQGPVFAGQYVSIYEDRLRKVSGRGRVRQARQLVRARGRVRVRGQAGVETDGTSVFGRTSVRVYSKGNVGTKPSRVAVSGKYSTEQRDIEELLTIVRLLDL